MPSSPPLIKLRHWATSNTPLEVSVDIPGFLLVFNEGPEAVTVSLERDDTVLGLNSGGLRVKFFPLTPKAFNFNGGVGSTPEAVVVSLKGGKLRLSER